MENRLILLTGCTRGLGRALLDRFDEAGHTVLGCGRSATGIRELESSFDRRHRFHALDVSDADQVLSWRDQILGEFAPPDLIVNNAAVINQPAKLWSVSPAEFGQLIDINVRGVFHVLHAFLPAMVERRQGVIVNFSSGWGRSVDPDVGPYCTSKWAIEGMTLALATELPEPMAAVPLNPGVVDTDMLRKCWDEGAASAHKPDLWSRTASRLILQLNRDHNGQQLAVSLRG